ncbi:MAG: hypothetical protein HN368_19800 [Spirochaetales bacterium]|jgi:hypothetical protein|nr:hypothetical protein [Spirochaetales bacterium]
MLRKLACIGLAVFGLQSVWAGDGFDDIFGDNGDAEPAAASVMISGEIGLGLTYYLDEGWDSQVAASSFSILKVDGQSDSVEGKAVFSLEADDTGLPENMTEIIDELYLRAFFPFGYLTAGLLKVEWGKGDGTHVIDPLNPLVQSGAVQTDIFEMKKAEVMTLMSLYLGETGLLELVYKPFFHPLQFAREGRWNLGLPGTTSTDTNNLEYSQAAARLTGSLGFFDLGALFYYGFMSEPGFEFTTTFTGTNPIDPTHYTTTINEALTRAQLFGLEGVLAAGPLTIRTELGYWLTEDTAADAPELYNDRFVYLGGVDMMIPRTSIFLSFQVTGAYVFDYLDLSEADVDRLASFDNTANSTMMIGALDIPFANDKMKLRLSGIYHIQGKGYMIIPEYKWSIRDDLELSLTGQIFSGEVSGGSPYSTWDKNDNAAVSFTYMF